METPPSPVAQKSFATFAATEAVDPQPPAHSPDASDRILTRIMKLITWRRNTQAIPTDLTIPVYDPANPTNKDTVLYLAYGSNLCAATFRGTRGIKPLSAANVLVPALELVFDLPGIPYTEPCFANTRFTSSSDMPQELQSAAMEKTALLAQDKKNVPNTATALGWQKGLVGVVYEVTKEDFAHIIATEGGGSSYKDILVDCYYLPHDAKVVDPEPTGKPFKAHTLFAKADTERT